MVNSLIGQPAIDVTRVGAVTVITWDRQQVRNALDPATLTAVAEALMAATQEPDCGACVLTGAGDIAFSSGMDLNVLKADPASAGAAVRAWTSAMDAPARVPIIAAVNGMAIGGGFEIALRCDLTVAAEHAVFGLPEVKRGIVPGGGGLRLPSRVPLPIALELGLTGAAMPAARLHGLGLVNRVVPASEVRSEAIALGQQIADHPPATVATIRQSMWEEVDGGAATATAMRRPSP